ncbi:hypothetical protein AGMMS49546_11120 [Spirochaetia bacterium]|nr:hypothetical protein AGMMS49546_11120 [Spirochaetia bacterium]
MNKPPKKLSPAQSEEFDALIAEILRKQRGTFSLEAIWDDDLFPDDPAFTSISAEELSLRVLKSQAVFSKDGEKFRSRQEFFKDAQFLILPTKEEVGQKILIPGHRFFPFQSTQVAPWECTLLNGDQEPAPKKDVWQKFESLFKYNTLIGLENLPTCLMINFEQNGEIFKNPETADKALVRLTVFDLTEFFKAHTFTFGDTLLCTVKDWDRGIYSFEYRGQKKSGDFDQREDKWFRKLEKGFEKTYAQFGLRLPMEEQIAHAYFFAGPGVLKDPPVHFGAFINASQIVNIVQLGMESRLWYQDEIRVSDFDGFEDEADDPDLSPFDRMLKSMGTPFSEREIEAYMRDELFQKRGMADNPEPVLSRLFGGVKPKFYIDADEKKFNRYVQNLWKKTGESYNYFADQKDGPFRSNILKTLDAHYEWMRDLLDLEENLETDDLPVQIFTHIIQTAAILSQMLEVLKAEGDGEEDIEELKKQLPKVSDHLDELREEVALEVENLRPKKTSHLRLVKSKKK